MDMVEVTYLTEDELYAKWYQCKECECGDILETFNYCPCCGKQINWEVKI